MTYLLLLIEKQRCLMIESAKKYGYTSAQAIECSQRLDYLLNQLELEKQNKRTNQLINP
jgi:hypothetical protein